MVVLFGVLKVLLSRGELEIVQKRAVIFAAGNYNYETERKTSIHVQLKWEFLSRKGLVLV